MILLREVKPIQSLHIRIAQQLQEVPECRIYSKCFCTFVHTFPFIKPDEINTKIVLLIQVSGGLVMITLTSMWRKMRLYSSVLYIISKATDMLIELHAVHKNF